MRVIFFTLSILLGLSCATKKSVHSTVLQAYRFEEIAKLMEKEARPIAIFLHTEWCKYCRNMEATTLKNQKVVNLLNDEYYFISLDGEQKEDIKFRNQVFKFQPKGNNLGTHELALALGSKEGVLSYPSFVILNPKYEIIFQHNAFTEGETLAEILQKGVE